ncbi:MAG: MFS transporter, partial [Chloroflexi bacterium]|nr:MFS transporter [Chloroflexota bacterium]
APARSSSAAGWRVLVGAALAAGFLRPFAQLIYSGGLVSMSSDLHTSQAGIGLTISVYGFCVAGFQIIFGPLVDRYSSKWILGAGMLLFTGASWWGSVAAGLGALLAARCLQGIGIAAALAVGVASISDAYAPEQRGRAMGLFAVATGVGATIAPLLGSAIAIWFGWRGDFLALAGCGLLVLLPVLWQLPAQPAPAQRVGLPELLQIVRRPATGAALTFGFAQYYAIFTYHAQMPFMLSERMGAPESLVGAFQALMSLSVTVGSLLGWWLADRHGAQQILQRSAALCGLAYSLLLLASLLPVAGFSLLWVALAVGMFGMAAGAGFPAQLSLMVEHFPALRATAGTAQLFARALGSTLAPVLAGVLSQWGGQPLGFGFALVVLLGSSAFGRLQLQRIRVQAGS